MRRLVGNALLVVFWLVGLIFRILVVVFFIASIVLSAVDYGVYGAVAAIIVGAIGVVALYVLYGLIAIPATALVAWLLKGTAVVEPASVSNGYCPECGIRPKPADRPVCDACTTRRMHEH